MRITPYQDHFLNLQMQILNSVVLRAREDDRLTKLEENSMLNQEMIMLGQLRNLFGDDEFMFGEFLKKKELMYAENLPLRQSQDF